MHFPWFPSFSLSLSSSVFLYCLSDLQSFSNPIHHSPFLFLLKSSIFISIDFRSFRSFTKWDNGYLPLLHKYVHIRITHQNSIPLQDSSPLVQKSSTCYPQISFLLNFCNLHLYSPSIFHSAFLSKLILALIITSDILSPQIIYIGSMRRLKSFLLSLKFFSKTLSLSLIHISEPTRPY